MESVRPGMAIYLLVNTNARFSAAKRPFSARFWAQTAFAGVSPAIRKMGIFWKAAFSRNNRASFVATLLEDDSFCGVAVESRSLSNRSIDATVLRFEHHDSHLQDWCRAYQWGVRWRRLAKP